MRIDGRCAKWLAVAAVLAAGGPAVAETVRCPAVKDVWVSSQPDEQDISGGKTEVMKLKVLQEMGLIGFDVSGLKGRLVKSADLYLCPQAEGSKFVEDRPIDLRWIVVSTVSSPWVEGSQSKRGEPDPQGKGASYREASSGGEPWAWKGGTLSDVINGNLNSIFSVHELVPAEGGYWKVPVDAKVIEALVAGLGDGLCLMDGSGTHQTNPFVYTREAKGKEPYLLVEVEGEKKEAPAAPELLEVRGDLSHATLDGGALLLKVRSSKDTFGLRVKVDDQLLEPWQVELPSPTGLTAVTLEDMPAGKEVKVSVAAVDAAGNESEWVVQTATVSDKAAVPDLPKMPFEPKPGEPKKAGANLVAWAFPEVVEVDPISAEPMFEKDKQGYRKANPVWSGEEGKVRLAAARGEIVAFQVALEQTGGAGSAEISVELKNPAGQPVGSNRVKLYRVWYVPSEGDAAAARPRARANRRNRPTSQQTQPAEAARQVEVRWHPEYLVPIAAGKVQVPMPDNKVPGQKLQAVYVDIALPGDAQAGTWTGRVRVKAPDGEASLPLEVVVYPVRIPVELNFNPELNTYSGPAAAGSDAFYEWHRLAHYNRCTLNRVPYSQNGQVHTDMIPKIGGKGASTHVVDWAEYDRRIGPLLSGSAFKGLPREGVPVKTFYLPLFENWPMPLEGHYQFGMPPKADGRAQDAEARNEMSQLKERHDLTVKPIDQAFDEAYKEGFRKVTRQFLNHYDKMGWTRTLCQMYQNNKCDYRGQWWILDEPREWTDWDALRFFASLFHQGIDTPHQAQFLYRGDISRPQWQAGFMGGLMDILYSGSAVGFANPRLLMHQKERDGMVVYIYGSCNPVERNSYESAAWCLKSFSVGGDGVLPWQSIGGDSSFDQPNTLGLLVTGKRFAMTAVPSMRVMALRHGAQQCELLKQVLERNVGWSRWHALALIQQKVPLEAVSNLRNVDQVTAASFQAMTAQSFLELKEGLLQLLSEGRGEDVPGQRIQARVSG